MFMMYCGVRDVIPFDSVGGALGLPLIAEVGRVPFAFGTLCRATRLLPLAGVMLLDIGFGGFPIHRVAVGSS